MTYDPTLLSYFFHAGLVVKCVMLILIASSIFSWTYIFQTLTAIKAQKTHAKKFSDAFWRGEDLHTLYNARKMHADQIMGMEEIFQSGFKEFLRCQSIPGVRSELIIENTQRAMRVALAREQGKLETHLPFLAIVGSTSPYVGLFGTVWGIMQAFRSLVNAQQSTIAMVAPGIAEALIATALGLFAAIPAAIFYNRALSEIQQLAIKYENFAEELVNILIRQLQLSKIEMQMPEEMSA